MFPHPIKCLLIWSLSVLSILLLAAMYSRPVLSDDQGFGEQLIAKKEYEAAMRYFWGKASKGDAAAMEKYALSARGLLNGNGMPIALSGVLVYPYYVLAANAGNAQAQHMVCAIAIPLPKAMRTIPHEADISKALSYCFLAARKGHEGAIKNLDYYRSDYSPNIYAEAESIADSFKLIPFPEFGGAPPPSWFEMEYQ